MKIGAVLAAVLLAVAAIAATYWIARPNSAVLTAAVDETEVPEHVMAHTMAQDLANLTVLGQSILGRPTYH